MPIDPEDIRKHYASMNDDALLLVEREDLTREAQKIFDAEIQRRGIDVSESKKDDEGMAEEGRFFRSATEDDEEEGPDEHELGNTFTVTTFSGTPAGIADATDARTALLAAGIPCEVTEHQIDPADEPVADPYREYRVMVPDAFGLQAASVLDTAIFNARVEADWKTQLESLSDDELKALNVDALCAGLLDKAERLRKAYKREVARRLG